MSTEKKVCGLINAYNRYDRSCRCVDSRPTREVHRVSAQLSVRLLSSTADGGGTIFPFIYHKHTVEIKKTTVGI